MSVIIRLQNLPWSANASDIREFFSGLSIPEGGVHIVGGELGDAFIGFSTDEDARLAMRKTGTALKGIQISLLLSSRTEMQKVIETARQQALGMQTYIAPPASIPQQTFQQPPSLPATLPQPQAQSVHMQSPSQQASYQSPNQSSLQGQSQLAIQSGFQPPAVSPQVPVMQPSILLEASEDRSHLNASTPGIVYPDQMSQQRSYNQQTYQTQIPQYAFQRPQLNNNFHPGVVSPNVNANGYYGQPANMPVGVVMPRHLLNSPDIGNASPSNNSSSGNHPKAMQPNSIAPQTPTASIPMPQGSGVPEKIDKRSSSTSSKEGRDKRDSKGRDERRRHSKSRSRSRERDRRRRHRSRSKSRSRDRSGRRRRSRSKERERKERERLRDKDRNRPQRDRNERVNYEEPKLVKNDGEGGIPGLGEIPEDIPKEGLSIFSAASGPSQSQGPITSSNEWPQREIKDDTEIQDVTMEDAMPDDSKNAPNLNLDQNHSLLKQPNFMGTQSQSNFRDAPFQNSPNVDNMDRQSSQTNVREPPKVWDQPPLDPRRMRNDIPSQQPLEPFVDQNTMSQRRNDMGQLGGLPPKDGWSHPSGEGSWIRPSLGRNEWEGPRNEQWNNMNNNSQNGGWNVQQRNDNWEDPAFARLDDRNRPPLNRNEDKNVPLFIPEGMRNRTVFNNVEGDRNKAPFDKAGDRIVSPKDDRKESLLNEEDRNRPPIMRDLRDQPYPDRENIQNKPSVPMHSRDVQTSEASSERNDWKRPRDEDWSASNSPSFEGDRWNRHQRNENWERNQFGRADERNKPLLNRDDRSAGLPPFQPDVMRSGRPPLIADEDRIRHSFNRERRSPIDKSMDKRRSPYNERSGSSNMKEDERNRPPIIADVRNKPFSEKESSRNRPPIFPSPRFREESNRLPPLMGEDFELINSPSPGGPEGDRRDHSNFRDDSHNSQRESRGFDHQNREGSWINDKDFSASPHTMRTPSFSGGGDNFRDFHSGRRGGFGGRDAGRDHDGSGFRERDSHFRGRHENEISFRGRGRGSFMRGRINGPNYTSRERTPCVEVLHLDTSIRHKIIKDFFVGAGIQVPNTAIKLLGDKYTKTPLGIALLKFYSTRDAFEATKLSGTFIYNSRVEINLIDEGLYDEMKDISEMVDGPGTNSNQPSQTETPNVKTLSDCLYVKGLPVGCTDHDVAKVFDKFKVSEIVLELEKGGRQPSGRCFVRLSSTDEVTFALEKLSNPNIDGVPIKIMTCKKEELDAAKREREKINVPKSAVRPAQSINKTNDVSKSEKKREELKPLNSSPEKMPKEILEAQKCLGNVPQPSPASSKPASSIPDTKEKALPGDLLTDSVVLKNVSPDVTEVCVRNFFSDEGLIPEKIYFNKPDSEGKTDVFVVFPKLHNARKALSQSSQLLRGAAVTIELINKPAVMNAMGLPFNPLELFKKGQENEEIEGKTKKEEVVRKETPVTKKPLLQNPRPTQASKPILPTPKTHSGGMHKPISFPHKTPSGPAFMQVKSAEPPPDFGKPGCVIALSNVPFSATTEDILEFFKEFSSVVRPENIIRRYDELNRPTADARVAFPNSNFAIQAVKKLDRKIMMSRQIGLCIVT